MRTYTPEQREQQRLYRLKRKEQKREYDKKYNRENKARISERSRHWRKVNKEYKIAKDREWRLKNQKRLKASKAAYFQENKDKFRAIDLKRNYGMTVEQYEEMLARQSHVCAICGGVNKNGKRLAVDHDHTTGKVRELLCASCNLVVGHCRESIENLERTMEYLRRHKPSKKPATSRSTSKAPGARASDSPRSRRGGSRHRPCINTGCAFEDGHSDKCSFET